MCRNIKTLFNFDPPATPLEVEAAAVQFVRKISGYQHPSKINEAAYQQAIAEVTKAAQKLLNTLVTDAPAKNREVEALKAHLRAKERFNL